MPRNPAPTESPLPTVPAAATAEPKAAIDPPRSKSSPKKAAKPKPVKPSDLLIEETKRERRLAEVREELAFRRHHLLQEGDELSVNEMTLLQTAHPRALSEDCAIWRAKWDRFLRHEDSRVETIISLQTAAGTPSDRSAADSLAKETANDRDSQAPNIEAQIRELQNQLDALNQSATDAKSAADSRHAANVGLRDEKLLPSFITDELGALHVRHTQDFDRKLTRLKVRRTTIESLLDLDVESPVNMESIKHHVGGNSRFGVDEFSRLEKMFRCETIRTRFTVGALRADRWKMYFGELRQELGDIEARIATIVAGPQAKANREVEKLKSFYCLE